MQIYNLGQNQINFNRIRITIVFMNDPATKIFDIYNLPYEKWFQDSDAFPFSLARFKSWFDFTNIICGNTNFKFSDNFYEYSFSFSLNTVSY